MTITNKVLLGEFIYSWDKFKKLDFRSHVKAMYAIAKNEKAIREAIDVAQETRVAIDNMIKEKAEKGVDGKHLVKDNSYVFANAEDEKEAVKMIKEFMALPVDISIHGVTVEDLEGLPIDGDLICGLGEFIIL